MKPRFYQAARCSFLHTAALWVVTLATSLAPIPGVAADVDALYEAYWAAVAEETGKPASPPTLEPISADLKASLAGSWSFTSFAGTALEESNTIKFENGEAFRVTFKDGEKNGSLALEGNKIVLRDLPSGDFWTCIVRSGGAWVILYASSETGVVPLKPAQ